LISAKLTGPTRFWAVFWVDVSSPDTAKSDLLIVAEMLGQRVESVEEACRQLANTQMRSLLILDNADDPSFDYNAYTPSSMQGIILMTSRCSECYKFHRDAQETLGDLNLADCSELLLKVAGIPQDQWKAQTEVAEKTVRLLQSHTLALIQAGAYVAGGYCKLEDYPKEFEQQRKRLLEFSPSQAQSRYQHVYATFEASAAVLSAHAVELLGVMSMLNHTSLPKSIFERAWGGAQQIGTTGSVAIAEVELGNLSAWNVSQLYSVTDMTGNETGLDVLNEWHTSQLPAFVNAKGNRWDAYYLNAAIALLSSLSLITATAQGGGSALSIHPLVHAWARDRQLEKAREANWLSAGCVITLAARGLRWRTQVEHAVQTHIQSWVDERTIIHTLCSMRNVLALVWSCSWMLVQMRDDARLHIVLGAVFQAVGLNPTRPEGSFVPLYHLWAQSHCFNGNWKAAVALMEGVVQIQQESLDARDRNRLSAEHLLGIAYGACGQIEKAVELLEYVAVREEVLARDHPERLASQHEVAVAYLADRQVKRAVALLEQVVAVKEEVLARAHPDRLASQHELASAYLKDRQVKRAIALLEHVIAVEEEVLARDHPDRLASQHVLAVAYLEDRQVKRAVALLEQVVAVKEEVLARDHPDRLSSQHVLAGAYLEDRQVKRTVALLECVVAVKEEVLARDHPDRLASQHELARAYLADRQVKRAVALLEHVVAVREEMLARDHPDRLVSQHVLAQAYLADRQFKKAVALLEHVVAVREEMLARDHPERLASQHGLAQAYLADRQVKRAVALLEHVVAMKEKMLEEDHPGRLVSQQVLARAYLEDRQVKRAVALLEHVIAVEEEVLAEDHPSRLVSQSVLDIARSRLIDRHSDRMLALPST
jgi:tetratricopeptide (TPR) repeat protein